MTIRETPDGLLHLRLLTHTDREAVRTFAPEPSRAEVIAHLFKLAAENHRQAALRRREKLGLPRRVRAKRTKPTP
jgi:hypothetical protein